MLEFSSIVRPWGHKQKKWINMVIQFPLFESSKPRCNAEFWYIQIGQLNVQVSIILHRVYLMQLTCKMF